MNNLSLREKTIMYILVLVVIGLLAYLFGIRTINNRNAELQAELQGLQQRKQELDVLLNENANTEKEVLSLQSKIEEIEQSFIADLKTENIENYVLHTLEDARMPFLAKVTSEDVQMDAIMAADGTASNDAIVCKRVNIEYSTTDGYEFTQYNTTPSNQNDDGTNNLAYIQQMINQTGKPQTDSEWNKDNKFGYDNFIKALKKIEAGDDYGKCIKITKIGAESTHGYLTLTASIDFYGADLSLRQSKESEAHNNTIYAGWDVPTYDTKGGFIGMPYKVENENSSWNGIMIDPNEVNGFFARPFAAYISNARFTKLVQEKGLAFIVGGGVAAADSNAAQQNQPDANEPAA